jgi:hypothetical protein
VLRGALAGIVAAAAWGRAEPALGRAFGVPYSDIRLLGAAVRGGPGWKRAGWALHLVNGVVFGAAFERLGGHGVGRALVAAQVENALLWPGMAVVDRFHPDRKSGAWPPLLRNGRVFAYEVATHAIFGIVLGSLTGRHARPYSSDRTPEGVGARHASPRHS